MVDIVAEPSGQIHLADIPEVYISLPHKNLNACCNGSLGKLDFPDIPLCNEDIFITQRDIREIQLAKAAIAAGIKILMRERNIDFGDIGKVYLAGGFGNYINHVHAMEIGLLPVELKGKVIPVGNAALTGSKMVVKSCRYMKTAEKIRGLTRYIELSTRLDFQDIFVDNMEFR